MKNLTTYFFFLHKIYNRFITLFVNFDYASKKNPNLSEHTVKSYNISRLKGPKKIICFAPFNHMHLGVDGIVSACCINKKSVYGTLEDASIKDLMNSSSIKNLRDNIENYNLSDGCISCQRHLEAGNYKAFLGRLYDPFFQKKEYEYPTEMTFEISNTCNLECIMCDGNFSSSIRKNREKLPPLEDKYNDSLLEKIKPAVPYLKVVHFQGGEPFLITSYYDIIEYIIQKNNTCKIYIQTNGTILNERVKKIIEYKNVHLSISIDSLKQETYESIRKNASFERLMNHMEYFKLRSKEYNQIININFCIMNNNWLEVPAMISFCNKHNFTITIIPVESPKQLSLAVLNYNELNKILQYYENPTNLQIINSNKISAAKYYDLIQSVKFYIERTKIATAEAEEKNIKLDRFVKMNIAEFKNEIQQLYSKEVFKEQDIQFILSLLEKHISGLDEINVRLFLQTILTDQNERTYNYLVNVYITKKDWKSDFIKYFEQMHQRINKEITINY